MPSELSQEDADFLTEIKKEFIDKSPIVLTDHFNFERDIQSLNGKDVFVLTFYQGRIDLKKVTYNKRHSSGITLRRLDLTDGQHTNPDGQKIVGPHVHIYKENFGDSFAYPITNSKLGFTNISDYVQCLTDFLEMCNIESIKVSRQKSLNNLEDSD